MTTPATLATEAPTTVAPAENGSHPSRAWHEDDDWHKGRTRVELPSEHHLRAYWHAEILDYEAKNPHTKIIERREDLLVRFRVELKGRLWKCIDGQWCFNLGFTPFGDGRRFNLSDLIKPEELEYKDWDGCKTECIERCVKVETHLLCSRLELRRESPISRLGHLKAVAWKISIVARVHLTPLPGAKRCDDAFTAFPCLGFFGYPCAWGLVRR